MNKPVKTKLCWNCEGSVSRTAENCPYCAVYLSPEEADIQEEREKSASTQKSTLSTKKSKSVLSETESSAIPKAPYTPRDNLESKKSKDETLEKQEAGKQEKVYSVEATMDTRQNSLFQEIYLPVLLLSTGCLSLLFSLILLLFATEGKLTLEWQQDLWPMFALIALPLLFFGWRSISSQDEG